VVSVVHVMVAECRWTVVGATDHRVGGRSQSMPLAVADGGVARDAVAPSEGLWTPIWPAIPIMTIRARNRADGSCRRRDGHSESNCNAFLVHRLDS
jgi:hypothetical protein